MTDIKTQTIEIEIPVFEGYVFDRYAPVKKGEHYVYADELKDAKATKKRISDSDYCHFIYKPIPTFEGYEYVRFGKGRKGDYCKFEFYENPKLWNVEGETEDDYFIYKKTFTPDYSNPDVLLAATMNQILDNPDTWDQTAWHSPCGTSHCFCGWGQVLKGERDFNRTNVKWGKDAFDLGFSDIFFPSRKLGHLMNYVDGILTGRIDRQTGLQATIPQNFAKLQYFDYFIDSSGRRSDNGAIPSDRFDLEEIQNRNVGT